GLNPAKQQIVVAQNGERISRHQFQAQVMDVVRDVENAYWDLVFSIEDLEVTQKSLQLARDLLRNNRIQVEVGTMAPIDVLEAEAEVAAREEAVILAEEAIQRNEDLLKRLVNDPESEDFWSVRFKPVDQPTRSDVNIDLEAAVRIALQRRPVLSQSRVELDTRSYNVRYTRNQVLPQVDLVGSLTFNGLGGDQIVRQGFAGEILREIPGGYSDALDQVFGGDFRDWTVALNVSYPLGNSAADAAYAQARVAYRQQRAQINSQELLIAQEVRQAARQVETNRKRIDATRVARELAQRRLEAEEKKFEVGMSTSFLIVQAQRDLAQAEANELRAVIDYNKALVAFERARGTLLDKSNISVR
ncbi:MAG: TolC family protein, partial [Acidobacteriota bacterium]